MPVCTSLRKLATGRFPRSRPTPRHWGRCSSAMETTDVFCFSPTFELSYEVLGEPETAPCWHFCLSSAPHYYMQINVEVSIKSLWDCTTSVPPSKTFLSMPNLEEQAYRSNFSFRYCNKAQGTKERRIFLSLAIKDMLEEQDEIKREAQVSPSF